MVWTPPSFQMPMDHIYAQYGGKEAHDAHWAAYREALKTVIPPPPLAKLLAMFWAEKCSVAWDGLSDVEKDAWAQGIRVEISRAVSSNVNHPS